jgi:hypothetical protein
MVIRPLNPRSKVLLWTALLLGLIVVLGIAAAKRSGSGFDSISAEDFTGIIREFSETGGYFISDNFISNEEQYLNVVDKMKKLGATGGAYIGVGPEQNFTYIARIRPQIAFIVDIRRQALIQQLMFKALFQLCETRTDFLARLLSRRIQGPNAPEAGAAMDEWMSYFSLTPPDAKAFVSTVEETKRTIQKNFGFPLSQTDIDSLNYVLEAFRDEGVYISFRLDYYRGRGRRGYGHFPTMREILEQRDPEGKPGNFLASDEDYRYVRSLQQQNKIIPLVGDFAGPKTIKAIAHYLEKHSCPVSVFYISNVEQFLFENDEFQPFVENVRALPRKPNAVIIRSVASMFLSRYRRPIMVTVMQDLSGFLGNCDKGAYYDYWILANEPSMPLN